jgi:Tfp pilus assembly protein PilF
MNTDKMLVNKFRKAKDFLINENNEQAEKLLEKLVKEFPDNEEYWLFLGIAKRRVGKMLKATKCFKNALKLNKTLEEAWGLLAVTYLEQDKIEKANETINEAAKLNPSNENLQFYKDNLVRIFKKFKSIFESFFKHPKNN